MKKFLSIFGPLLGRVALFGLILLLPSQAWAGKNVFKFLEDMEIHGFVSSSYSYNFNKPMSQTNCGFTPSGCIRIFDTDDNTFKLDNTELVFLKDVSDVGDIGFRFDLTFGFSLPEIAQRARSSKSRRAPIPMPGMTTSISNRLISPGSLPSVVVSNWIWVNSSPMSVPRCSMDTTVGT